jgi:hypothetical protein
MGIEGLGRNLLATALALDVMQEAVEAMGATPRYYGKTQEAQSESPRFLF